MRDEDRDAASGLRRLRGGGVALEQRVLGLGVERRGRLVEDEQQRPFAHEPARERELLPLPERHVDAARPDQDLDSGSVLPELRKPLITKLQLVKYAGASGDYNLIHTDDETARAVGLEGVIAHGMLSMAFLGEYLCWLAGPESVRRLSVRFVEMVRPGDTLTCRARVKERTTNDAGRRLHLEVWAENQRAERVTVGEAEVAIT